MNIDVIFDNNRKWIADKTATESDYFEKLAQGQNPDVLYIGCADSRVTAEEMVGAQPGDLFVHRNIANVVTNTDINAMCVINYAVVHLKVRHVVVCGHYGCGGVKAAMQAQDLGILNPWLRNIRDVYRFHQDELDAIDDMDARYKRLVELNALEQCINVLKTSEVQIAYEAGELSVHAMVMDIASGQLINLNLDTEKEMESIREIYRLT